jgi:mannose-6-phosphate isomerase-like protein (cupin superfamily)
MLEVVADPRNGVPMHIHTNEDEHFIVLEGTLRIANGDTTLDAQAGTAITVSKGCSSRLVQCNGRTGSNADNFFARTHRGTV